MTIQDWDVQYLIYGKEFGELQTPHLQGYLELKDKARLSTMKILQNRAHWEPRMGSQDQAINYCKKEDTEPFELGTKMMPGKRNDIHEVAEEIKCGKSLKRVAEDHPGMWVKYYRGFKDLKMMLIEPRNEVPDVTVLVGKTGCGKTRKALEILGDEMWMWQPQCGQWFDGYEGEENVLFDEFRGQLPFGMLLSLLDRYQCKVQYKGGMAQFRATKIVITSPKNPLEWYQDDATDKIDQLLRRLSRTTTLR